MQSKKKTRNFGKMIITNTKMSKLLSLNDSLSIELNEKNILSDPLFYESEGFVLLKETEIEEINKDKILKIYKDYTGYEAFCNEYNIENYFDTGNDEKISLQIAFKLADIWKERLEAQFPDYAFIIPISRAEDYSNIRFYRYRPEEAPWLLLDNLEGYSDEAVAAVIVNPTEELRMAMEKFQESGKSKRLIFNRDLENAKEHEHGK